MRNSHTRVQTQKKKLDKCKTIFHAYNDVQYRYGDMLDKREDIVEIRPNVRLEGCGLGDFYTSDFVCKKKDGSLMVRECLLKAKLMRPSTVKMLDASRDYWLARGVGDWGIVLDGSE